MKSIILLIAIALVLASLFLLLFAAQNGLMYRRTADAKAEYYDRLRRNVVIFFNARRHDSPARRGRILHPLAAVTAFGLPRLHPTEENH